MKKSDTIDFSIPQRQSYVAILMIIWKTYVVVFRQVLPLAVLFILGGSKSKGDYFMWGIIAIATLSMVYSIIAFFKFQFHIEEDELIIQKGIFNKKKISIDIDRVQTINFEQNIIHKVFEVARLKADTAGSVKEEFNLDAIDKDIGHALRDRVMKYKAEQVKDSSENNDVLHKLLGKETVHDSEKLILEISPVELFMAGMVENHLKSSGIIFGFFFYIYFNMQEVGLDPQDYTGEIPFEAIGAIVIIMLLFAILLASFFISMTRMVLKYYDLKLVRSGNGFRYTAGLFTKRMVSALDQKIQKVTWSDNLLKKTIGIFDLKFEQAGSEAISEKKSITVPACKINHVETVLNDLYSNLNLSDIQLEKISKYWLHRQVMYRSLFLIITIIAAWFISYKIIVFSIAAMVFLLHAFLKYKKAAYGHDQNYFFVKGGMYGDKHSIFPIHKVQSIKKTQSPYMRRKGLISLTFFHASGSTTVPYVEVEKAFTILNFVLLRVESSKEGWM